MPEEKLVIATRASDLAITQAKQVLRLLRRHRQGLNVAIHALETSGDDSQKDGTPLYAMESVGVFVKDVEILLLEGRADMAVHSLKDMPVQLPEGLMIAAVPPRDDARDCLVASEGRGLRTLPRGSRVGTSSLRRMALLRARRPDLDVQPIRGNIPTRLRKVDEGEFDACVVAYAGLRRLGLEERASEVFSFDVMLPAAGQGALAVEIREEDGPVAELCRPVHDQTTANAVAAERHVLQALGGGCTLPLGAYASVQADGRLMLDAVLAHPDGKPVLRARASGGPDDWQALADAVSTRLHERGAEEILQALEP